jgi:hypothetical protein
VQRFLQPVFAGALLGLLAACASGPHPADPAKLPDDFSLSITVLAGQTTPALTPPAWYVLGPDGVLHIALGERLLSSPFPPAVRTLSREQVRHVWELVVASGLADTKSNHISVPDALAVDPKASAVIYVAAASRRQTFSLPRAEGPTIEPVVTELRRLGWVPKEPARANKPATSP